jgi:hypothetical protein
MAYTRSFLTRAVPRQFKSVRYYLRGWPARGPESWKELPRDLSGGMLPRNERNGLSPISRSSRNSRTSSRNVINGETVTPRHALGLVSVKSRAFFTRARSLLHLTLIDGNGPAPFGNGIHPSSKKGPVQ